MQDHKDGDNQVINIKVCEQCRCQDCQTKDNTKWLKNILNLNLKNGWLKSLSIEMTGKTGMKQCAKYLPLWEVDTVERVAMFVAQCGHESGGFRVLSENLNYSAKALNTIFPKYFRRAGRDANEYHRQPEKIANVIYANRMDNGDTDSGDGWTFQRRRHSYNLQEDTIIQKFGKAVEWKRQKKQLTMYAQKRCTRLGMLVLGYK